MHLKIQVSEQSILKVLWPIQFVLRLWTFVLEFTVIAVCKVNICNLQWKYVWACIWFVLGNVIKQLDAAGVLCPKISRHCLKAIALYGRNAILGFKEIYHRDQKRKVKRVEICVYDIIPHSIKYRCRVFGLLIFVYKVRKKQNLWSCWFLLLNKKLI